MKILANRQKQCVRLNQLLAIAKPIQMAMLAFMLLGSASGKECHAQPSTKTGISPAALINRRPYGSYRMAQVQRAAFL